MPIHVQEHEHESSVLPGPTSLLGVTTTNACKNDNIPRYCIVCACFEAVCHLLQQLPEESCLTRPHIIAKMLHHIIAAGLTAMLCQVSHDPGGKLQSLCLQ